MEQRVLARVGQCGEGYTTDRRQGQNFNRGPLPESEI